MTAAAVLDRFAEAIDARDWSALRGLLAPGFSASFVHTGQRFDAEEWVAFNSDYPGHWRFRWEDVVVAGDRGVGRARVSDDQQVFHVASFVTIDAEGLVSELVEVWTEGQHSGP